MSNIQASCPLYLFIYLTGLCSNLNLQPLAWYMASTVSEAMEREEEGTVSALFEGSHTLLGECRQFKKYRKKKEKEKRKRKKSWEENNAY